MEKYFFLYFLSHTVPAMLLLLCTFFFKDIGILYIKNDNSLSLVILDGGILFNKWTSILSVKRTIYHVHLWLLKAIKYKLSFAGWNYTINHVGRFPCCRSWKVLTWTASFTKGFPFTVFFIASKMVKVELLQFRYAFILNHFTSSILFSLMKCVLG